MIREVVIVGGGTAGWLTAAVLASRYKSATEQDGGSPLASQSAFKQSNSGYSKAGHSKAAQGINITLIESQDIPPVGVGEGTWPTMRSTLQEIGISETELFQSCDASLKQGTLFREWLKNDGHHYYHPFTPPAGFHEINLAEWFHEFGESVPFAQAVSPQAAVCDQQLSAKQISTPEFGFNLNYGYHLDAGKFVEVLKKHCVEKLGVRLLRDHVTSVNCAEAKGSQKGNITSLHTKTSGAIHGDLFIDCTGLGGYLIRQHYEIGSVDLSSVLFNDRALAVQIDYEQQQNISSATLSTAQQSGWVWDIGLSSRRGVGYVYSSQFCDDEGALNTLRGYIEATASKGVADSIEPKKIGFSPQYLTRFWHQNCVAVGLSAGFVEPLEASALILIEMSAKAIADAILLEGDALNIAANKFNDDMTYHWEKIVNFLKLHYVLSQRDEPYWAANRNADSIPHSLQESLAIWEGRVPWHNDTPRSDELFSSASFQYVLYGMNFKTKPNITFRRDAEKLKTKAKGYFSENQKASAKWLSVLPENRTLSDKVKQYGFPKL